MKLEHGRHTWGQLQVAAVLLFIVTGLTSCGKKERVSMFEGSTAQDALTELSKKFAPSAKALNIDLTPLSLTVRVQDPAQPSHVDEYSLEHSYFLDDRYHSVSVSGPTPVQLNLINEKLEENLFPLSDVNIAGTAATAKEALQRASLQDAAIVERAHIQRHLFLIPTAKCGDVEWDITIKSPREYASAYANAKGQLTRLNLDGTNRAKNLNLFADNKELLGIVSRVREVFGSTRGLLRLHLNRNFLGFDARDPRNPKHVMDFTANLNGVLMGMASFEGRPGAPVLPEERFFAVDEADWSRVPTMIQEAQAKLEIPKGELYKITLTKPTLEGAAQPLRWIIDVQDGEGEDGEVEFDAKGTLAHVKLPKSRRVAVKACDPEGARQIIAGLKTTFGHHAKLIELALSGNRASVIARDPKSPAKIRDWLYEDDHFLDFKGTDQTPFYRDLQDGSFMDLDEVETALPPKLVALEKAAQDQLKIAGGKVESVTVCRQPKMQPPSPKTTVQITIKGDDDKTGWVSYDFDGKVVQVMTP